MTAGDCTRVYTPRGRVAHLMRPFSHQSALCPAMAAWPGEWLGTGSQREYERAAALPLCAACERIAGMGTQTSPAAGERETRLAAGVTMGRQAIAAAMTEAELEEHVRAICKDLGITRIHVYSSRGTTPGVPDDVLVGPGGLLWRELKTMRGKVSAAQHAIGEALTVAGQDFAIWRPDDYLSGRIARELTAISRLGRAA